MKNMKKTLSSYITMTLAATGLLALTVLVGCRRADSSSPNAAVEDAAPVVKAGHYTVDPAHSEIGFRVKHLGISTVRGIFNEADAVITFPEDKLAGMQVEATIQTASVYTDDAERDGHLRSADFFDAENHPVISFKSTEVAAAEGSRFTLKG